MSRAEIEACAVKLRELADSAAAAAQALEAFGDTVSELAELGVATSDRFAGIAREVVSTSRLLAPGIDQIGGALATATKSLEAGVELARELLTAAIDERAEPGAPTPN